MIADLPKYLTVTTRCEKAFLCERLEPFGIQGAQYAILLRIAHEPGITQETLSRRLCIHKSNIARQAEKLENAGMVLRTGDGEDKRVLHLSLTEAGEKVIPEIRKALEEWSAFLTAEMNEEELDVLTKMMKKVKARAVSYFETGNLK